MSKVDSFGQDFMAVNFTAVKFQYKSTTFFSHKRKNIKKSRRKHPVDASDSEAEKSTLIGRCDVLSIAPPIQFRVATQSVDLVRNPVGEIGYIAFVAAYVEGIEGYFAN